MGVVVVLGVLGVWGGAFLSLMECRLSGGAKGHAGD